MADLEEALVTLLLADVGFTAVCGERLFPVVIPQDVALPSVAYQRISGAREYALDGRSGLARPRIQFTCVGNRYSDARNAANALREVLSGYRGTVDGVWIQAAFLENEDDAFTDDSGLYSVQQDYFIWYREN